MIIKMNIYNFTLKILLMVILMTSCEKEKIDDKENLQPLSEIKVNIDNITRKAQIKGEALSNTSIQLKYKGKLGNIITKLNQKNMGVFEFNIDLLPDLKQDIELVAKRNNKEYNYDLEPISPYTYKLDKDINKIKELLMSGKWSSNQLKSRIIKKQTNPSPPYDIFVTVAQKTFDFNKNNNFIFEVSSPLKFTHNTGTWNINTNNIITINTQIPLGPMEIKNGKIHLLNNNSLSLLVNISDGIFLIYLDRKD